MKTNSLESDESPRLALWTGLAIALVIALSLPFAWLIKWVRETETRTFPQRRVA
jgi:hypothetical protein